ncbi:hypothetical protein [Burkholderia ambifaria]|jgi:hypothetical protein|uniref:hypothetical protein n=1 Tax=Burkholderia ambifaria TaxID=152480 RepID=UPI00158E4A69|nr:hypothetical protein [Burkholderia ambifaria]
MSEKQSGIDALSRATGLSREDMLAMHAQVKANHALLDACSKHAFSPIEPGRLLSRHRCVSCGGEVDAHAAHWYARGLLHAGAK